MANASTMMDSDKSVVIKTDSRNKISLGQGNNGYYRLTKTDYGFELEKIVDFVTELDQRIQGDNEFWDKTMDYDDEDLVQLED